MAFSELVLTLFASIPTWAIIVFVLLIFIYFHSTKNFGYWEKQGVKVTKPWPLIGSMSIRKMQTMDELDSAEYQKHGRIFGYYVGKYPMLMVAEPELLKKILVKDFHLFRNRMVFEFFDDDIMMNMVSILKNDEWKRVRNILTPTFTTGKLKQMIVLIEECAQQLIKHLQKFETADEPFEARQCCASYAVDVIATCSFGTKINSLENPDNEFVQNARKVFGFSSRFFVVAFLSETLFRLLAPYMLPDNKMKYFAKILEEVIESRMQEKEPRRDFLQLLLEAEVEENLAKDTEENSETTPSSNRKVLSRIQVLAQAIIFLVAGSETTAITFCLTLYSLALDEECQTKLIEEIDRVLKDNEHESLNYDIIAQMQYLDMVICEILRLYPPLARIDRVCEEDGYKLNENITLKKGMAVGVPIYAMHYDEQFYPNPHKFDPERFSPENRSSRDPYTYLPFGFGPRNCIGMRFALLELKIGLIHFFKEFRVKKCSKTEVPFKRDFSAFIQPKDIYLKLESRKKLK